MCNLESQTSTFPTPTSKDEYPHTLSTKTFHQVISVDMFEREPVSH